MIRTSSKYASLLAAAFMLGAPLSAEAQCAPDARICAEVEGPRGGGASISIGRVRRPVVAAPPPPMVAQAQPGRVVVVQPAPAPPPGRVVVVQPAPPPPPPSRVVVVQPQPQPPQRVVVVQPQPAPPPPVVVQQPVQRPRRAWRLDPSRQRRFGITGRLSGTLSESVRMGGIAGALRIRPIPHFAVDVGVGVYAGTDYVGNTRVEVPIQANGIFFINPQHRVQLYALAGVGGSVAHAENGFGGSRDFAYLGGEAGLGVEWRVAPRIGVSLDVRGFIRHRVDSDPRPEYVEDLNPDPNIVEIGRTTDTSAGATLNLGATLYF